MALESLSVRRTRWKKIQPLLKKLYSSPKIGLSEWKTPYQLVVSTILSAQCTDARVNLVTKELFKKYKTPQDFLAMKQETLEKEIRSTGFYKAKAKNIRNMTERLVSEYKGKVPQTMDELITLAGVGRKTANIVLFHGFGMIEGIAVDTHVFRVSKRLGLSDKNDPTKVEKDLMDVVERPNWGTYTDYVIWHGRKICEARKPLCSKCPLLPYCPQVGVTKHG